jgi:hypothetical protein
MFHKSDLRYLNKWIDDNSADPNTPVLTDAVIDRHSVSQLLSAVYALSSYIDQTERVQGKPYFSEEITDDGLWEMANIQEHSFPDDVKHVSISTWKPGAVVKPHMGPFKGVIRLHIGLHIPPGDCWLSLDGKKHYWKEGEVFAFDDTYLHYGANETDEDRVILYVDLERKMNTEANQLALRKILNENMYR